MQRRPTSLFSISDPIVGRNGEITFGIPKKFKFLDKANLADSDIKTHVVTIDQQGKWDVLAGDLYGDINLYWILIMFNHVINPLNGPKNQEVIKYPSPQVVFAEL